MVGELLLKSICVPALPFPLSGANEPCAEAKSKSLTDARGRRRLRGGWPGARNGPSSDFPSSGSSPKDSSAMPWYEMLTKLRTLSGSPSMDRLSIEAAGKQICKSVTTPKMWVQSEKKG